MPGNRKGGLAVAAAASMALALAACSASSGSGSKNNSDAGAARTSVDVGNGTISVPKTGLRVGIFFNAQSNAWQVKVATTIKQQAEALGWTAEILDPGFDVSKQLNQLQSAATQHKYDAAIVVPIDDGECKAITETLPKAGILVTVLEAPVCNRAMASGDALWVPGTLNYVGGDTSADYYRAWFAAAAAASPGKQNVGVVIGPELSPFTLVQKAVAKEFQKANTDFQLKDYIYTDYTTPSGYSTTLTYLRSHPDTTVLLSVYTPDLTRGVVNAVKAAGMTGKVKIVDIGASQYTAEQIKAGTVQATLGFFPEESATNTVKALQDAIAGTAPARFVSVIPAKYGSIEKPVVITKDNVDSFTPEF